ncbi:MULTISPECIES: ABC transporter ATP-binding protein [Clostridium]|uniref:ABC transporter ATP-binding protein n=1 Tax=Clostridium cibarium TaxID=2762247 RepID=A0ABR8PW66_9CLOT|nr:MULTISPECIES: ABC transporter ATP-binding protein [Clostridium]MBD7912411.1 ABC transporter ATP-binding protein [Clostridium cibarium]
MVEIKNVSLELDDKEILHNINLNIEKGKIYGLIGPNGVGKTTLIKCLTGIYKPSTGEILYDGENVYNSPRIKMKLSYVADENNFFSSFTVKDILKYYKLSYENFNENKFHKLNKIFNIPLKKHFYQLSKGMKMRVALLVALASETEYLIMDEPTSGLDPILKNKLLKLLVNEVALRQVTIIISSHHLGELERICDDVAILDGGKISYKNTLEDMKKKIKKLQIAFDSPVYEEDLNFNGIFKMTRVGRVFTIITDNFGEDLIDEIKKFKPLFIEEVDLSLEDIFIYKVEKEELDEEII